VPGQRLVAGAELTSATGGYVLTMQDDGNLVVYAPDRRILFATYTAGNPDAYLQFQTDGDLILWAGTRRLWASNTMGGPKSVLILQGDGNLVLYGPGNQATWWSNR
jgi:hypothetical protein